MAKKTFEKALQQLEQIVADLEAGDIPLEKTLQKFEEGVALSTYCADCLDETEKRVSLLLADNRGKLEEVDFSPEEG